ncbi:unnamed protein product [Prorocentrum cordatum]|uniref:Uncharacterized protein n=1 Tax=Prorocentrum cordatum TaxID=2364126 RepID=A0ABN9TX09_9DINO|nr:unnamed protein product [Polarella glacialis]
MSGRWRLGASGDCFVTGSFDQTARGWEAASGADFCVARGRGGPVVAVAALGAGGDRFVTGSWDGTVRIWDAATGVLIFNVSKHGALDSGFVWASSRLPRASRKRSGSLLTMPSSGIARPSPRSPLPLKEACLISPPYGVSPELQFYPACCALSAAFAYVLLAKYRKLVFVVKICSGAYVWPHWSSSWLRW